MHILMTCKMRFFFFTRTQIKGRLSDFYPTLTACDKIKFTFQRELSLMVHILTA